MRSKITFSDPLAYGENYPPPAFSMVPLAPRSSYPRPRHLPNNVEATLLTTRARYALPLIAKALLREGDAVLLPAYHCPALVESFVWTGCQIKFCKINADLSPK
jgi:perosamine synthetase